jgi:rhamnosyltransferase subunit B
MVERCGLRFLPFGTAEEYSAAMNDPAMWNPSTSLKTLWKAVSVQIRPLFDLLLSEVDDDAVLVSHPWGFGARLLHEKHGVPLVTVQISPSTFLSAKNPPIHRQFNIPMWLPHSARSALVWAIDRGLLDRLCAPDINRVRADLGMAPVKHIMGRWMHSPQGGVGLFPEWFAPPQKDWPAGVTLTGFPRFDGAEPRNVDGELEEFLAGGPAPIVFTPGSTLVDAASYYAVAARALDLLGCRGIFLASQNAKLPELTRNILARPYVPLSKLLPRARALVHHGGIGTASQAFASGIPQLITPFAHDQFDNAARVERLGCGFQIQGLADEQLLAKALRRLLEEEHIQRNCAIYQSRVDSGETACRNAMSKVEAIGRLGAVRGGLLQSGFATA